MVLGATKKIALAYMVILKGAPGRIFARGECKTSMHIYAAMDTEPNGEHVQQSPIGSARQMHIDRRRAGSRMDATSKNLQQFNRRT